LFECAADWPFAGDVVVVVSPWFVFVAPALALVAPAPELVAPCFVAPVLALVLVLVFVPEEDCAGFS
jgi:hypothetical protein